MTLDRRSGRPDGASVLLLVPAGIVIVLLLGAIAVDSAIVYLEQRQAYNVAFDAANDAAGAAVDRDLLRKTGTISYAAGRVETVAAQAIAASGTHALTFVDAGIEPDGTVAVTVEVEVRRLFGQAFGGRSSDILVVTARATAEQRAT